MVTLDSGEYLIDFLVVQPKTSLGAHQIILGRPWLERVDALINCRTGQMTISNGLSMKKLTLYHLDRPIEDKVLWVEN